MNLELYKFIVQQLPITVKLRHDVDVSPEAALELAKMERSLGISAHYYIMVDSPYYHDDGLLWKLRDMGHRVGLHVEAPTVMTLTDKINAVEMYKFDGFTLHKPHVPIMGGPLRYSCSGLRNDNLCPDGYVSDARGIMPEIPSKGVLNLHPEWWVYPGNSPKEKLEYYFNQQKEKCLKEILPDLHS